MKTTTKKAHHFKQVTFEITCETPEELVYLLSTFNTSTIDRRKGYDSLSFNGDKVVFDATSEMKLYDLLKIEAISQGIVK